MDITITTVDGAGNCRAERIEFDGEFVGEVVWYDQPGSMTPGASVVEFVGRQLGRQLTAHEARDLLMNGTLHLDGATAPRGP